MTKPLLRRVLTIKTLIRVAFTGISLASIGAAHSQPSVHHHPAQTAYSSGVLTT